VAQIIAVPAEIQCWLI